MRLADFAGTSASGVLMKSPILFAGMLPRCFKPKSAVISWHISGFSRTATPCLGLSRPCSHGNDSLRPIQDDPSRPRNHLTLPPLPPLAVKNKAAEDIKPEVG